MVREFQAPVEKLYEACKSPETFFATMGDLARGSVDFKVGGEYRLPTQKGEIKGTFLEIVPNKKIKFSWLSGCSGPLKGSAVILTLNRKDNGGSSLELIHEGLSAEIDLKGHRSGWEMVTEKMSENLGRRDA